jgi:hypothetical protein
LRSEGDFNSAASTVLAKIVENSSVNGRIVFMVIALVDNAHSVVWHARPN